MMDPRLVKRAGSLLALWLLVLALVIASAPQGYGQSSSKDVTVTNTPLPVTGSVGIEGTPTVNVAVGSPWHTRDSCTFDGIIASCILSIPPNVVIDSASVEVSLPATQQARVRLRANVGGLAFLLIPVGLQMDLGGIGSHTGTLTGLDLEGEESLEVDCLPNNADVGAFCDISLFGREV
jgi:hypothetical protein